MRDLLSIGCIVGIFCMYTLYLIRLAAMFTDTLDATPNESRIQLHFPRNLTELNQLAGVLIEYKRHNWYYVVLLFCSAYVYKQCFAIPGSVFLNLLAGALFGVKVGFPLCCLLTACGASGCYLMSKHFGKSLIERLFQQRLLPLQRRVQQNRDSLFMFLLFLRLFPMSPNWFLNIASPIVHVPIVYFFPSVFFGLMPYNFITVEAGEMLSSLQSVNDLFTAGTVVKLFSVSLLALGLALLRRRYANNAAAAAAAAAAHGNVGGAVAIETDLMNKLQ